MFSQIFIAFLQSTQNFARLEKTKQKQTKKNQFNTFNISEFTDSEKCGYLNAQKLLF